MRSGSGGTGDRDRDRARRRAGRLLAALTLAGAPLALVGSNAAAATVSINLCATDGSVTMPDGVVVPVWGFADGGAGATPACTTGTASLPGPSLSVNEGDAVTINVTNALPGARSIDIEIPGITFAPASHVAPVGGTVTLTFSASSPGTFIYESSGDAGRQTAMGLAGSLVVRPTTAGQAYDNGATAYDVEAPLVLGAIDPNFNASPDSFVMTNYAATYWLINGKSYPQTAAITGATAGKRVLLRYVNAGYDATSMVLLGMHERVLARSARLLGNPFDANTELIPAGATEDVIATVPSGSPPSANGYALYNRQLHVTNGHAIVGSLPNANYAPGGMLTFLRA